MGEGLASRVVEFRAAAKSLAEGCRAQISGADGKEPEANEDRKKGERGKKGKKTVPSVNHTAAPTRPVHHHGESQRVYR